MNRINVLFVIWSLDLGGAERVVAYLANNIDRKEFRPVVCCLDWRGSFPLRDDIPVYCMNKKRGIDLSLPGRLAALCKNENIDVINSHMWTANLWSRLAVLRHRVPVVVTEHNADVWKGWRQLLSDRFLRRVTSRMIAVSETVKKYYMAQAGYSDRDIAVVTNGIVADEFDVAVDVKAKRIELGLHDEYPVLGVVGRLVPQKGHRFLFDALPAIIERYPDAVVLVAGDGPLREELERRTSRALAGHVRFIGGRQDIAEVYQVLDMVVMPSEREAFPMTVLETLAAGKPIVATEAGDNRKVINDPDYGEVVPLRDAGALADAVLRRLARRETPETVQKRRGYIANSHSSAKMVAATENILLQAVRDG